MLQAPKQSDFNLLSQYDSALICFYIPARSLPSSMDEFVPCDHLLQKANLCSISVYFLVFNSALSDPISSLALFLLQSPCVPIVIHSSLGFAQLPFVGSSAFFIWQSFLADKWEVFV